MATSSLESVGARTRRPITAASILPREGFIVSRAFDLVYFILSPLIGLLIIRSIVLTEFQWAIVPQDIFGVVDSRVGFAIGVWTYAHLFAVVFRSHLNGEIFRLHRIRFVVVPIALFAGMVISPWILVMGLALTWLWDVYHSSMQVFGFCRIYDAKLGNPRDRGRRLDIWMAHLVYIAPIFMGLGFRSILEYSLAEFRALGFDLVPSVVEPIVAVQAAIAWTLVVAGVCFVVYYVRAFQKLAREEGYRYSRQKFLMLVTTGCVSFYAWGFLHPFGAFFVSNFFHGLQYFAMVWWSEKRNMTRSFGLSRFARGHLLTLSIYLLTIFSVGVWYKVFATRDGGVIAASLATLISLMHFWYDGFIWSVQKRQV